MRLCVVCDNVSGGSQIVQGSPESYSELTFLLQRHLRFADARRNRITGIHVFNTSFNEWVPVDVSLRDLTANNKIRVQCDIEESHPKAAIFYEEVVAMFLQAIPSTARRHELEDAIDAAKALAIQDKEASVFDMRAKQSFQTVATLIKGGVPVKGSSSVNFKSSSIAAAQDAASYSSLSFAAAPSAASRIATQARSKAAPPVRNASGYTSNTTSVSAAASSPTPYHSMTGLHGTSPSKHSAATTTSPRTGAYRPQNSNYSATTADLAPNRASVAGSGLSAVAAIASSSPSSGYRKAARTPSKAANPSSSSTADYNNSTTASSGGTGGNITVFCVYSGTTSQRAKAIQVQRSNPGYDAIIKVLRQKFNSDLSLGHISVDGECTEITSNEDLKQLAAGCGPSLTLHCWAKAGVHFNELSMNGSMLNSASRPQSAMGSEYGGDNNNDYTPNRTPNKRPVSAMSRASSRASNVSGRSYRSMGGASAVSFTPANDRDVSGTAWNTKQLREVFEALDVDGSGCLSKEEVMDYFRRYHDDMGIVDAEKKFSKMLDQCSEMDDGVLTFDEFSVIMLRVAQW